ncbi:MAG: hypothetical protein V1736_05880, partial [Pseudomonadota bacterium]
MAESYAIPSSSLGKIQRWYNAKKAAGQIVQPWELEAAYEGEMNALQNKQTANRGLTLQAEGLTMQAARDAESRRMNDVNTELKREEIEAGEKSSTMGALGTLGTTALMAKQLGLFGKTAAEIAAEKAAAEAAAAAAAKLAGAGGTVGVTAEGLAAGASQTGYTGGFTAIPETAGSVGAGITGTEAAGGVSGINMTAVPAASGTAMAPATGTGLYGMAGGVGATPAFTYTGPAAAGYLAPKLTDMIHKDSM